MKHSIRQHVFDPVTGLKVTKIETVNGELGSQVFVVEFTNGHFGLTDDDRDWIDLDFGIDGEIIDHVDD